MINASIITIGNEIISGSIVDTNSKFLSERLTDLCYNVNNIKSVGDNELNIIKELRSSIKDNDYVFIVGGLGPTIDDITKLCVAKCINEELVIDETSLKYIESFFEKRGRIMPENNIRQAYKIKGSEVITNHYGTAPGYKIDYNGTIIYLLPGPPFEMEQMFIDSVVPNLRSEKIVSKSKLFRCVGIGESSLESKIDHLFNNDEVIYGIYANKQFVDIKLTVKSISEDVASNIIGSYSEQLESLIGKYIYSNNHNIQYTILDILKKRDETIAIAESCTGGMLSSMFIDTPGFSSVFNEGVVTYSNESKVVRLGVNSNILEEYGAVSIECVKEMARGVSETLNSSVGVAITGIAGPDGGSKNKPVGLVYIGVYYQNEYYIETLHLKGNRFYIRHSACLSTLSLIYKALN